MAVSMLAYAVIMHVDVASFRLRIDESRVSPSMSGSW
jgi:hypothetical protein